MSPSSNINSEEKEHEAILAWKKKREERKQLSNRDEKETSSFSDTYENLDENEFDSLSKRKGLEEMLRGSQRRVRKRAGKESVGATGHEEKKESSNLNNNENDEHKHLSLLESAAVLQKSLTHEQRVKKQKGEEEERIMREASKVQT
eukprot:scaffold5157_cov100-Cylindrotheca_fusiformis.AAC.15